MSYKIEEIEGIGDAYAKKLREVGIKTTEELLTACAKLLEANDERNLCGRIPSAKEIEAMVLNAKEMEPMVTY